MSVRRSELRHDGALRPPGCWPARQSLCWPRLSHTTRSCGRSLSVCLPESDCSWTRRPAWNSCSGPGISAPRPSGPSSGPTATCAPSSPSTTRWPSGRSTTTSRGRGSRSSTAPTDPSVSSSALRAAAVRGRGARGTLGRATSSLRPRVGVPRAQRAAFIAGVPALAATWALGGFYLSLGPTLVAETVGSRNLVWGGLAVGLHDTSLGFAALCGFAQRDRACRHGRKRPQETRPAGE